MATDRKHQYQVGAPAPTRSRGHWAYGLVPFIFLAAVAAALVLF